MRIINRNCCSSSGIEGRADRSFGVSVALHGDNKGLAGINEIWIPDPVSVCSVHERVSCAVAISDAADKRSPAQSPSLPSQPASSQPTRKQLSKTPRYPVRSVEELRRFGVPTSNDLIVSPTDCKSARGLLHRPIRMGSMSGAKGAATQRHKLSDIGSCRGMLEL